MSTKKTTSTRARKGTARQSRHHASTQPPPEKASDTRDLRRRMLAQYDEQDERGHVLAMRLVERILEPTSADDAASALFDLIMLSDMPVRGDRAMFCCMAGLMATLHRRDWMKTIEGFSDLIKPMVRTVFLTC